MIYREFLADKSQLGEMHGFDPLWLPPFLLGIIYMTTPKGTSSLGN